MLLQPGSEGKDALIGLGSYSNCEDFYYHSGNDSIITVIFDDLGAGCSKVINRMLIQFSFGLIPVNALVLSARLEVYGLATINIANQDPSVRLSKVNCSWNESTTEWIDDYYLESITTIDFIS